ncbi:MAG: hypothetical protein A3F83_08240 [Candidatus Glassbacteria bacterium RIFCSPLOWO2_12_FULL_58_11]|uniref:VOC domain-containing protein n=1 Tax=Candidatus Glassbacteria bacterium RIFCSPLOWO2_12_FULL_58_11 TaxID=1817867 RepID=A0A1F5YWN6_9BACT|nr:MAG: hypothetical protein A3F83_08240 [Candidatus Glassbacteria bacterium RIFCSPLOWO2_12_FULL_58_11]
MGKKILGIHHITALAGDPQENFDFYAGFLGLRLLKKTVNYDDPQTYHFYYGDAEGSPGTVLTFFPVGANSYRLSPGAGLVSAVSWSVPAGALEYWIQRLGTHSIEVHGPFERFGERAVAFQDPDGLQLELVETAEVSGKLWEYGPVSRDYAIRGIYSATLTVRNHQPTEQLLIGGLELRPMAAEGNRRRYISASGGPGRLVDILEQAEGRYGIVGLGAVHHIAWRTPDDRTQLELRGTLEREGYALSPVLDRNYFRSVYFREPGRILFEIATDPPGFMVDEPADRLGTELKLPRFLEAQRETIERFLEPVAVPEFNKSGAQP